MNESIVKIYSNAKTSAKKENLSTQSASPRWSRIEVILKVTERCNIDCTYCYFFNSTNQDFKEHPAYIQHKTVEACAKFLANAVRESNAPYLQIDFHGGEPLMMKKHRFDEMCNTFKYHLNQIVELKFAIQTNAMLIDHEWLSIFAKHEISIGISLDGPKHIHDTNRIDHQKKGTYDQSIKGLRLIQDSDLPGLENSAGVICVIDPDADARTIFNHFVDDLQLKSLHYILPIEDHDTFNKEKYTRMTKYLCDLFDAWVERKNPEIQIRYFFRLLSRLTGGKRTKIITDRILSETFAFTVASNGDIGPADDLRNTFPQLFRTNNNVFDRQLKDFIHSPSLSNHFLATQERHEECLSCCWGNICDGGDILGSETFRYSRQNSFKNKSVYCTSIEELLTHMTNFTLEKGVAFEKISEVLITD